MSRKQKHQAIAVDEGAPTSRQTLSSAPTVGPDEFNFYYSSSVEGDISGLLGAPHYSYRFAESKFVSAISAQKVVPHKLLMPEYYNSPASLPASVRKAGKQDLHLIFRSTEQIRLLKFAWNICCFAWEFDVIKDDTDVNEHPFLNQKRMLSLCDEIWVPCSYTKSVLDSYSLHKTHLIPAPIVVPQHERPPLIEALSYLGHVFVAPLYFNFLQTPTQNRAACSEGGATFVEYIGRRLKNYEKLRIYLTILNPEDFRKNLDAMLRAFYYFSRSHKNSLLIVKVLTSSSRFSLLDVLSDVIPKKLDSGTALKSDNIIFFNEFLSDREMSSLFSIADFYLCTAFCEGQNLPLLEAMAHGVVPVSTANTAMADYITNDNAVIIRDRAVPNDCIHMAATNARRPFSIRRSKVEDIHDALTRSSAISPTRYATMSARARQVVQENYSPEVIWSRIMSRLTAIHSLAMDKQTKRVNRY
ncbi:MAG: glycosyltransferase [Steroidobacteraceae bacterium]